MEFEKGNQVIFISRLGLSKMSTHAGGPEELKYGFAGG